MAIGDALALRNSLRMSGLVCRALQAAEALVARELAMLSDHVAALGSDMAL